MSVLRGTSLYTHVVSHDKQMNQSLSIIQGSVIMKETSHNVRYMHPIQLHTCMHLPNVTYIRFLKQCTHYSPQCCLVSTKWQDVNFTYLHTKCTEEDTDTHAHYTHVASTLSIIISLNTAQGIIEQLQNGHVAYIKFMFRAYRTAKYFYKYQHGGMRQRSG
jgi:hypothetical protein